MRSRIKDLANSLASRGIAAGPALRHSRADAVRAQIQASFIVTRLQGHIAGEVDMTPTQIKASEILLKKILPDLQVADLRITESQYTGQSNVELLARARLLADSLDPTLRLSLVSVQVPEEVEPTDPDAA